jgi:hypothetical protein
MTSSSVFHQPSVNRSVVKRELLPPMNDAGFRTLTAAGLLHVGAGHRLAMDPHLF